MPLPERLVLPTNLGSHPIQIEEGTGEGRGSPHFTVANNSLVGALLQLASIVRHADDIFCDITEECNQVFERTKKVCEKIGNIQDAVTKLDARNVVLPVGELSAFNAIQDHHETNNGFDCDLFTKETRPQSIKDQYQLTDISPSHALRGADQYRKDGLNSSRLFKFWPVTYREPKRSSPDLNLCRKFQSKNTFVKPYKKLKTRPKTICGTEELYFSKEDKKKEENAMAESLSLSKSSSVVAIDTSEFQRSNSVRGSKKSLSSEEKDRRKARRKTVSGVADHVLQEIQQFDKKRRNARENPRDYSFGELDMEDVLQKDEYMTKYLEEIEAKMEERQEEEKALRSGKFMKFISCKRSKSLPRCLKMHSLRQLEKQSKMFEGENEGSCQSLASNISGSSRMSRSTKRSSIISNKLRSLVRSSSAGHGVEKQYKPRPKSLDLDAALLEAENQNSLAHSKMPSMPDGMLNSNRRKVGPGSYYDHEFESNTLPRRGKRIQNDLPWENLPKDWTSSVKLREISKRCSSKERQSSSGNWSGYSSSNRQSLDSDVVVKMEQASASQTSLGNDSGRCSPTTDPDDHRSRSGTDTTGCYAGDESSTVTGDSESNSDSWLKNLAKRAASREDVSSSSADTLNSLTKLTKQNIMALDRLMTPTKRRPICYIDDDESVYSVDQDGWYTSFHADSGLRRSTGTLIDEDEYSLTKESINFSSSDSEKYAGLKKGGSKVLSKVNPPAPPMRTSSCPKDKADTDPSSPSDGETVYDQLHKKTEISVSRIPSMCLISSDDDKLSNIDRQSSVDSTSDIVNESSIFSISTFDGENTFKNLEDELDFSDVTLFGESTDFDNSTLPRVHTHDKTRDYNKSWPRAKKKEQLDTPLGILKGRDQSPNGTKPAKSLNFSPVLDLCNHGTTDTMQVFMPDSPPTNTKRDLNSNVEYKLSVPIAKDHQEAEVPMKYQPVIVVKPGNRTRVESKESDKGVVTSEGNNYSMPSKQPSIKSSVTGDPSYGNVQMNGPSYRSARKDTNKREMDNSSSDSFMGSLLSLISGDDSVSDVGSQKQTQRGSGASSPNLSNLDFPMITTPTASTESIVDLYTAKKSNKSVDNSNISTPGTTIMETVAISTNNNSFSSVGSPDMTSSFSSDQPFKTFTGSINTTMSSSTPYSSNSHGKRSPNYYNRSQFINNDMQAKQNQNKRQARVNINQHSQGSNSNISNDQHYGVSINTKTNQYAKQPNIPQTNQCSEQFMPSSKSFPSNMSDYSAPKSAPIEQQPSRRSRQARRSEPINPSHLVSSAVIQSQDNSSAAVAARNSSYRVAMKESKSYPLLQKNIVNNETVLPSESPRLQQSSYKGRRSWQGDEPSPAVWLPNSNQQQPNNSAVPYEPCDPEDYNRADSYRYAVRNTMGNVVPPTQDVNLGRNTSYRVAIKDMLGGVSSDARGGRMVSASMGGRDVRRMGITDVDQVKGIAGGQPNISKSKLTNSSRNPPIKESSRGQAILNKVKDITRGVPLGNKSKDIRTTQSSGKIGLDQTKNKSVRPYNSESHMSRGSSSNSLSSSRSNSLKENHSPSISNSLNQSNVSNTSSNVVVRRRRAPKSGDEDPISVIMENTSSAKSNKNRLSTSSTYMRFDPIMEGDSMDGFDPSAYFGDPAGDLDLHGDQFYGDNKSQFSALDSYANNDSPNSTLTRKPKASSSSSSSSKSKREGHSVYVEGGSSIV